MNDKKKVDELMVERYRVTQQRGTEACFAGKYSAHRENGMYLFVLCGEK